MNIQTTVNISAHVDPVVESYIEIFHLTRLRNACIRKAFAEGSPSCMALEKIHADYQEKLDAMRIFDSDYSNKVNDDFETILLTEKEKYSFNAFMNEVAILFGTWLISYISPSKSVLLTLIKSILTISWAFIMPDFFMEGVIDTAQKTADNRLAVFQGMPESLKQTEELIQSLE